MKDSWKRPIKTQKQIDYPTQTQFVFKPRDATPEEAKEWQEKELNWWAEKQLAAVAIASVIQFSVSVYDAIVLDNIAVCESRRQSRTHRPS